MNREERKNRDLLIVERYKERGCAESIARDFGISTSSVYAITQRHKAQRKTSRGVAKLNEDPSKMKLDFDAYTLVARKATKSYKQAQLWLTRANFLDKHPQTPLVSLNDIGASKTKVLKAIRELVKINATLSTVAPFRVIFTASNKYLEMTHRQYIVFLAHPFHYLLDHKEDIQVFTC